jgi:hypothetical protein
MPKNTIIDWKKLSSNPKALKENKNNLTIYI